MESLYHHQNLPTTGWKKRAGFQNGFPSPPQSLWVPTQERHQNKTRTAFLILETWVWGSTILFFFPRVWSMPHFGSPPQNRGVPNRPQIPDPRVTRALPAAGSRTSRTTGSAPWALWRGICRSTSAASAPRRRAMRGRRRRRCLGLAKVAALRRFGG